MLTPQDGYSTALAALPEGFTIAQTCKKYHGCYMFPLRDSSGRISPGDYMIVDIEDGTVFPCDPIFVVEDFLKAPDVTDQVDFKALSHHGVKGMHWGMLSAETLRKYGYGTKKHLAKAEKLRAEAKVYAKKAQTAERRRQQISNIKGPKQVLMKKVDKAFHRIDDLTGQTKATSYEQGDAVMRHIVRKTIGGKMAWDPAYAARRKLNESEVFLTEAKLMQDRKAKRSVKKAAKLEKQARKEDYKAVKSAAKKAGVTLSTSDKVAVKKGDVKADRAIKNIDKRSFDTKKNLASNSSNKAYQKEAKKLERKYSDNKSGKQVQKALDTSTRKLEKQAKAGNAEAKAKLKARKDFISAKSKDVRMTRADKASLSNRASSALSDASKAFAKEGNIKKTVKRWRKGYDD